MTDRQAIDNSEWSTTEEIDSEWYFTRTREYPAIAYRFDNGLDVNADVTAYFTDKYDRDNRNRDFSPTWYGGEFIGEPTYRAVGGLANNGTSITVSSDSVETRLLEQRWDMVVFGVTPASNPSSGSFEVIRVSV